MLLKHIRNEKGVALVLLALSIIVLFGFGALAVDVGHLYNVKNQLQAAADAAALAGAARLDGNASTNQPWVKDEAARFAAKNTADIAYNSIPATTFTPGGAGAGAPIPVALNPDNDVTIGYWDTNASPPFQAAATPNVTIPNAVKVIARRTGASASQPRAQNMFAKVLGLLGADFDFTAVSAESIAANDLPPRISPIIVNEYWYETAPSGDRPYGTDQVYPQSFVRQTNVDGSTSKLWGNTFAIMGTAANPGGGPQNPNGFVCMDFRYSQYSQGSLSYTVVPGNNDCSNCTTAFTPGGVSGSKVEAEKYLYTGYPPDRLPPTAALEPFNSTWPDYNPSLYSVTPDCPYSTMVYFETSGGASVPTYPVGGRYMCTVYDGTHIGTSTDKLVKCVGYVVIEVDGYDNGDKPPGVNGGGKALNDWSPKSWLARLFGIGEAFAAKPPAPPGGGNNGFWSIYDPNHRDPVAVYAHNRTLLQPTGNTMYAHAYTDIIQPKTGETACQFIDRLRDEIKKMGSGGVHLVGPAEPYGMAGHS